MAALRYERMEALERGVIGAATLLEHVDDGASFRPAAAAAANWLTV